MTRLDYIDLMSDGPGSTDGSVYDCGMLDVGDGNQVFWQARGNPVGRTVMIVHVGPGSGMSRHAHTGFDPVVFRIVSLDQSRCGRSVPSAADPQTDMAYNTTGHLLADMEALRTRIGVDRWLLYGGSWASTLILAYAECHPERVSGIMFVGDTMTHQTGQGANRGDLRPSSGYASRAEVVTQTEFMNRQGVTTEVIDVSTRRRWQPGHGRTSVPRVCCTTR